MMSSKTLVDSPSYEEILDIKRGSIQLKGKEQELLKQQDLIKEQSSDDFIPCLFL